MAAELSRLGHSIDVGELGWSAPEALTLVADNKDSNPIMPLNAPDPVWVNFIVSVDIDWDKWTDGLSGGCGIAFRDQDHFRGETILLHLTHLPLFNSWNLLHFGNGHNKSLLGEGAMYQDGLYADTIREGTNHYALVVDGGTTTVYINGGKISAVELPDNITEGELALYSWRGAGTSSCTFTNFWLWELP